MIKINTAETISSAFLASANEAETIFMSYRELHAIYFASFRMIEKNLDELPLSFQNKLENAHKVFENALGTVKTKQKTISDQLYAQGLVLLVGNAESLTREMFHTLLKLNIRKVNIKKNVSLSLTEVLSANTDEKLAELVLSTLESEGNPSEKLNFQNMHQLQAIMDSYLGIKIDSELARKLHEHWQIRHIIIHNAAVADQRFIDNIKKAKLSITKYTVNEKVIIDKKIYDDCFGLLTLMFQCFDDEIERLGLKYNMEAV